MTRAMLMSNVVKAARGIDRIHGYRQRLVEEGIRKLI